MVAHALRQLAAVSCRFVGEQELLDLQYSEGSQAAMDANFVMTASGSVIDIQATSEDKPLPWDEFMKFKMLAEEGISSLAQRLAVAQ